MQDPYAALLEKMRYLSGTNTEVRLAKLILSLYNSDFYNFSVGESLSGLDSGNKALAKAALDHYMEFGETQELREAGEACREQYPRLYELAKASYEAMLDVKEGWRRQEELEEG